MMARTFHARSAAGLLLALLLAGCAGAPSASPSPTAAPGGATSAPASAPATSAPATAGEHTSTMLRMVDTDLGRILVDEGGFTVYLFTRDTQNANASTCEGQCLANWPAVLGAQTAGEGVDDSRLGTFTRSDGRVQASYNGWPLYYWIRDMAPGQTTGQNVQGVWYVLDSDGDAIKG